MDKLKGRINKPSVLWNDSTTLGDYDLLASLVSKAVVGDDEHKDKCILKMLDTIDQHAWQQRFTHRNFVHSIIFAMNINLIEISFSLSAQAIDALYYLYTKDSRVTDMGVKIQCVFNEVYGHTMPSLTSNTLRILRNNIMHTGAIFGIEDAIKQNDKLALSSFVKANQSDSQQLTDEQILIGLAGGFTYLVRDMVVRVLGLSWEDLSRNLKPPSRLSYFDGRLK